MPEMFGIMAVANTMLVVLALLSDIGLRQKIIQSKRGEDPVFLNTVWTIQVARGFVLFAVSLVIAALIYVTQSYQLWPLGSSYAHRDLPLVLAIIGLTSVTNGFQSTKSATAFRTFQQDKCFVIEVCAQLTALVAMLGVAVLWPSVWALVVAAVVASLTSTLLSHYWLRGVANKFLLDRASVEEVKDYGRWILVSSAAGILAVNCDRLLFGATVSATDLGMYSIAVLIIGALETGYMRIVSSVCLPVFSEVVRGSDKQRLQYVFFRFRLLLDSVVALSGGLLFSSAGVVIAFLYDSRYSGTAAMLSVLAVSTLMWSMATNRQVFLAIGSTKYLALENLLRLGTVAIAIPTLLAIGGFEAALWGVALYAIPAWLMFMYVMYRLQLFSPLVECVPLASFLFGCVAGHLVFN